jgi:hypothetical protein
MARLMSNCTFTASLTTFETNTQNKANAHAQCITWQFVLETCFPEYDAVCFSSMIPTFQSIPLANAGSRIPLNVCSQLPNYTVSNQRKQCYSFGDIFIDDIQL